MNIDLKNRIIDGISDKIEDKLIGLEAQFPLAITPKLDPESIPSDGKSRAMYAAIGALAGLAASGALVPLVTRGRFRFSKPQIAAITASTAFSGATFPEVHEIALAKQRGDITNEEAVAKYKKEYVPDKYFSRLAQKLEKRGMDKSAATPSMFGAALKQTSKFTGRVGGTAVKEYASALTQRPWKGNLGERTFGLAVKGATGYDLYRGARGIQKQYGGIKSGQNYTTFIRNQVLAGNVQPTELSQQDLISVRKLGLR